MSQETAKLRAIAAEQRALREEHAVVLELLGEKEEELEAPRILKILRYFERL